MKTPPRIAVTAGEPAGVGPELCAHLTQQTHDAELVFVGDSTLLRSAAAAAGYPLEVRHFNPELPSQASRPGRALVHHVPLAGKPGWGQLDVAHAPQVLACLDVAIQGCTSGTFAAMVTAPLHKGIINDAGVPFTGHTEYLASATQTEHVVMLLVADDLRVALATTHLPLAKVSAALNKPLLQRTIRILHDDLRDRFQILQPTIAVCGLNPHAGEGGHLGDEEQTIIEPALEELRIEGLNLRGPLPADTAFARNHLQGVDAVLAMFHDQGLPVLKYAGFGNAVNVTLGLPIIRTSVDHGTALDIAGQGLVDPGSMEAALVMACKMAAG